MTRHKVYFPANRTAGPSEHRHRAEARDRRREAKSPFFPMEGTLTPEEAIDYRNSDPLQCLFCGDKFQCLGRHLIMKHEVSSRDYCERFGIPWKWKGGKGLATNALRQRMSEAVSEEHRNFVSTIHKLSTPHGSSIPHSKANRACRAIGSTTHPRRCERCLEQFRPSHAKGRFCSKTCAQRHHGSLVRASWRDCIDCGNQLPASSQHLGVVRCKTCNFAWRRAGKP